MANYITPIFLFIKTNALSFPAGHCASTATAEPAAASTDAPTTAPSDDVTTTEEDDGDDGGSDGDFDVDEYCADKDNGFYAYPDNCRKYVECESEPDNLV